MSCQHKKIRTWVFEDTKEPAGMWSCIDCSLKFVPITEQSTELEPFAKEFSKVFALMRSADDPCTEVMAVGQLMKEWLQSVVADAGTVIDTGKGFSEFDLWVQCEGKELFITIKEKKPTK